ncbi:MAG: lamin tail domain-containing protein [Ginsengibacter sp.]
MFLSNFGILLLISIHSAGQLSENFNDGNFTGNPVWIGNTEDFIVNSSLQLQSNNTGANSSFYLSTANENAMATQWEFFLQINFNPSSANYVDVYLTASASDLSLNSTTGYIVRIGNTDDEISLYRKEANGTIIKIIDGVNGVLNKSSSVMKIKVIRDASGQWILNHDLSGTGNTYTTEGSVSDVTYTTSSYFGFLIKQSTSSFFQKHFIDDIEIKGYVPDVTSPTIQSAVATSTTTLDISFDEPVEKTSASLFSTYAANNSIGMPVSANVDAQDPTLVHLTFENHFTNGVAYILSVNGIKDLSGNVLDNGTVTFSFYRAQQYDVVIDEVFPDPTPQVGLPNYEWLELKNTSAFSINLKGWRLSDINSISGALPDFTLQPDSFVIVCSSSALASLSPFGKAISVTSFPSLDNDNDLISLSDATGKTIHAVNYSSAWYPNELKKGGGWSLEMIDTKNPCSGFSNWTASTDPSGGTPGRKNSAEAVNKDSEGPKLLRAFASGTSRVTLVFDEPLDSMKASSTVNYTFGNDIQSVSLAAIPPLFDRVTITLNKPLAVSTVYTVTVKNISDCAGNPISTKNMARFGIGEDTDSLDLVINEILYNPLPGGVDYIELYNRSNKIIDLSKIFVANRNSTNAISSIQQATTENILLFPTDYIALSTDPNVVKSQYIANDPDAFLKLTSMPSFPDNSGYVIILNGQGNIVDEVAYSDKWQFALLRNTEGVSLERIDYDGSSVQSNFHSAATSVGYGTPGYKNSQFKMNENVQGEITITPEVFSPDNDGLDDFLTINYRFPSSGYVANITVFDASGRRVRHLQKNSLSGITGYYRWDGLDDKQRKLPQGIYIIYTEVFNTSGKKRSFKNTVVLTRR